MKNQKHFWSGLNLTIFLCSTNLVVRASHVSSDSFPSNDEYDFALLDPNSLFGSPYGGYSRATRSRLASLPLKLPNIDEEVGNFDPWYEEIRDAEGRLFICRVYHQDELEEENNPSSLYESMFDLVQFQGNPTPEQIMHEQKIAAEAEALAVADDGYQVDKEDEGSAFSVSVEPGVGSASNVLSKVIGSVQSVAKVYRRLQKLDKICAQFRRDWWTYEWCHGSFVTQFHVQFDDGAKSSTNYEIVGVTSLGKYSDTMIQMGNDIGPDSDNNAFSEGHVELARTRYFYTNGDLCEQTGKPRETEVIIRCCSPRVMNQYKGVGILKNGLVVASDIVAIHSIVESQTCAYNFTVCSPLMCVDPGDYEGHTIQQSSSGKISSSDGSSSTTKSKSPLNGPNLSDPSKVQTMSIHEILEATFNVGRKACVQTATTGWWTYELCPGKHIRQYHEATGLDKRTGFPTTFVETEHYLGHYKSDENSAPLSIQDEWKHVVNVTGNAHITKSNHGSSSAVSHDGNGAYFQQEYSGGDVCDHTDVTEAAIKAGNVGEGGIERATSVRYSCGARVDMIVREDSTCHYIAEIFVPALCHHPLFKAPVSKQQIVKCIPALS